MKTLVKKWLGSRCHSRAKNNILLPGIRGQSGTWQVFWCVCSNWGPRSEETITKVVTRLNARWERAKFHLSSNHPSYWSPQSFEPSRISSNSELISNNSQRSEFPFHQCSVIWPNRWRPVYRGYGGTFSVYAMARSLGVGGILL